MNKLHILSIIAAFCTLPLHAQDAVVLGDDAGNESWVVVSLDNRLTDWARVRRIAADNGIDLNTKSINGNQITCRVPAARRGALTIAMRDAGWRYTDKDGVLYISK